MGLFETLKQLKNEGLTNEHSYFNNKKLQEITEDYKKMNDSWWVKRVEKLDVITKFSTNTKEHECFLEKSVAEFEYDEIRYKYYEKIVLEPIHIKQYLKAMHEELESIEKYLECLEAVRVGLQIELDV